MVNCRNRVSIKILGIVWIVHVCIMTLVMYGFYSIAPTDMQEDLKRMVLGSNCSASAECGHGKCEADGPKNYQCVCDEGYIDVDGTCNYAQKSQLAAFILSLFLGLLGADYFYLSTCLACDCYICLGFTKIFTAGGLGFWYIADLFRIGFNQIPDGSGHPLKPW